MKPHDIFEANDLFENTNHTQVQSTLIALASQVTLWGGMGCGVLEGWLGGPWGLLLPLEGHQPHSSPPPLPSATG